MISSGTKKTRETYALITGASSGIGFEIADLLADRYALILASSDSRRLRKAAERIKRRHPNVPDPVVMPVDLSDRNVLFPFYQSVSHYPVEVLVNAAGIGVYGSFDQTDADRELSMLDLNAAASYYLTKRFYQDMGKRGGGFILNVDSSAGYMPGGPMMAAYYASKAYVFSLTRSIQYENPNNGVSVSLLCPGPVRTDFHRRAGISGSPGKMSPKAVARSGVRGMFAKKRLIIPGFWNRFTYIGKKILPDAFLLRINAVIQRKKSDTP